MAGTLFLKGIEKACERREWLTTAFIWCKQAIIFAQGGFPLHFYFFACSSLVCPVQAIIMRSDAWVWDVGSNIFTVYVSGEKGGTVYRTTVGNATAPSTVNRREYHAVRRRGLRAVCSSGMNMSRVQRQSQMQRERFHLEALPTTWGKRQETQTWRMCAEIFSFTFSEESRSVACKWRW